MATTDRLYPLEDGPWNGMVDSVAPTSKQEGRYLLGQNIYPLDPASGDGVIGRPGLRVMGGIGGSVGARRVQGHFQYTKKNGTEITGRVVGGKFYTLNWTTEVWTEVLTTAQLLAAGVVIDTAANQIAFITFSDQLVVSDGVNLPWMWNGTSGGGITRLTNAAVAYGQPAIYSGRLMFIKAADPVTFIWSEADLPNTGYEAGGYNNSWTLTQTDPNRLYHLLGTNDALNIFRARSATSVTGTVTSNFVSAATRDSLSDTEGTTSPFAVITADVNVLFLDADMHPQVLRPGAIGATPLWTAFRETLRRVPKTPALASKALAINYSPANLVMFAICDVAATEPNMLLVFDVKGSMPIPVGIWRGFEMTSMAMVKNASGSPYWMHGDSTGYSYMHGNPEDALWNDALVAATASIHHVLETQALGFSVKREKIFDRVDLSVRALSRMTLDISLKTSRGQSASQQLIVESGVPGWDYALWDSTLVWDVDVSLVTQEAHGDVGVDDHGRWARVYVSHNQLNEQFGLVACSIDAYVDNDDPEIP